MKTTGFKGMVVVLAAMLTTSQVYAGWGGGARRAGGWYGPQLEQGIQGDTEEQGPWMRPGSGRGGPETQAWQGGPGRGLGRGQRMGRGLGRRFNGPAGLETRLGRGGRPGRGYQGADICPYCQGTGCRPVIQRRSMRGNWQQGLRDSRVERGFRRGENILGRGSWGRKGRGLQVRNYGLRGQGWQGRSEAMQRGPWSGNRGQGPRPDGIGRGKDFGPKGPGRGFEPGRGGRGFWRSDTSKPDEQGQYLGQPDRGERPFPRMRGGRGREGRPRLRQGPRGPAERPEVEGSDTAPEPLTDANNPKADSPTGEDI